MSLEISRVTPMLQVKSLDETIEFYTNTLGFKLGERAGG
jgi:catechol 2,3-dioxygenase-like lactoylglutathione lyase family enzyme